MVKPDAIRNITGSDPHETIFQFATAHNLSGNDDVEILYMSELLKEKQNTELLEKVTQKPAMYSNVYSPEDELEIFIKIFEKALHTRKKVHIVGMTLKEEILLLEKYYEELGFMREDINCFEVDFSQVLISASVYVENLIWKGSDYKAQGKNIFFIPPVRESGQNKAMFTGINRGTIAGIYCKSLGEKEKQFLTQCITHEKILPLMMSKVLFYNFEDVGIVWESKNIEIEY